MITRYLPYTLRLRAPAILTAPGGNPNSARTFPYIPGSALRGAVARLLDRGGEDPLFRTLVLDGCVRYLNAYPRVREFRSLPRPLSLYIEKDVFTNEKKEIVAFDLLWEWEEKELDEANLVPISEPYIALMAAEPLRVQPKLGSRIHQQRDRERGRAWKEDINDREVAHGTIFIYEYLEAGQEFDGFVIVEGRTEAECTERENTVKRVLSQPIWLGRSRRAGYGGDALIEWRNLCDREVRGEGVLSNDIKPSDRFRVLLTSPYIGRNPKTGQVDPSYLEQELFEALGGKADVLERCWSFGLAGGFNRKWRLEVPQAYTCAEGSVLLLEARQSIQLSELLAVEHKGLGERRIEGFGRIVFLRPPVRKVVVGQFSYKNIPEIEIIPEIPPEIVSFVERRIVKRALEKEIIEKAAYIAKRCNELLHPSLLGRLRNMLRNEPNQALKTLQDWLEKKNPSASHQAAINKLNRCKIGGKESFFNWLQQVAKGNENEINDFLLLERIIQ